ncbi:hypothetical protein [Enterocloster clostridioformis]|uniref:hypothetical protein n=1 Tax=Enterocloster clostridioformis TaxID=1531 RepID=UPI001FA78BBE|nr:hypothetical protein [Enterocloster clostridioformis]MCA5577787.1 hypothetical protein [Enterocloster clostridioformis]
MNEIEAKGGGWLELGNYREIFAVVPKSGGTDSKNRIYWDSGRHYDWVTMHYHSVL